MPRATETPRIPLSRPGRGATRARLAEILRVDHAGEFGAVVVPADRAGDPMGGIGSELLQAENGHGECWPVGW